jgi:phosphonatase-like hydrolase
MDFQLVVFDLAGTTVKDEKNVHRVLQSVLRNHGVDVAIEDVNYVMGIPKPVAIRKLLTKYYKGDLEITSDWINEIHGQFVKEMISFYQTDPSVAEKEGVSTTFRHLKDQGIKVAVDTGFDREITDAILHRLGWLEKKLIDFSVTSDEVALGRPYADMIFKAMKGTGVSEPKRVVKVGDTISDLQQGRAAACGLIVGVTSGACSAEDLKEENPHHLITQVPELLDLMR